MPSPRKAESLPTASTTGPAHRSINLRAVRVHNLRGWDLEIPLGQLVVITGVSGSGKSSLAFDTVFAEGRRRYLEYFAPAIRSRAGLLDHPACDEIMHVPPVVALRQNAELASAESIFDKTELSHRVERIWQRFGELKCPLCQASAQPATAATVVQSRAEYGENGRAMILFPATRHPPEFWVARGFVRALCNGTILDLRTMTASPQSEAWWVVVDRVRSGVSASRLFEDAEICFREAGEAIVLTETGPSRNNETMVRPPCSASVVVEGHPWHRQRFSITPACISCEWTDSGDLLPQPSSMAASTPARRHLAGCTLEDISSMSAETLRIWLAKFEQTTAQPQAAPIPGDIWPTLVSPIRVVLNALCELGLGHLVLKTPLHRLSSGERRRVLLAALFGAPLVNTLFVLDEPSAGLHPDDRQLLVAAMRRVVERRNSLLVVDHSAEVIRAAETIIELGPGGGPHGGELLYVGPRANWPGLAAFATPTAAVTNVDKKSQPPRSEVFQYGTLSVRRRQPTTFTGEIPLGRLTVLRGRSGCGKSRGLASLRGVLDKSSTEMPVSDQWTWQLEGRLDAVVLVDSEPLSQSKRSTVATTLHIYDEIRQQFAETAESRLRNYTAGTFSHNTSEGGRCGRCEGMGSISFDLEFLPDLVVPCPECDGQRFRREILEVGYRSRSIAEVLALTVGEAVSFFRTQAKIAQRLQFVRDAGLGYLVLGQPARTLSGGEAQRIRLATHLASPRQARTLFLADDPARGLHPGDIAPLIELLKQLTAAGHTVLVADHAPQLAAAADWVIDLPSQTDASPRG